MKLLYFSLLQCLVFLSQGGFGQPGLPVKSIEVQPYSGEHGLRQSMVTDVLQDRRGLIWMTTGSGLHCFDGREFKPFRVAIEGIFSHSDNLMYGMEEEGSGSLLIATASSVLRFDAVKGTFRVLFRHDGSYPFLVGNYIWINHIGLCAPEGDTLVCLNNFNTISKSFPAFNPAQTVSDPSGMIYMGGQDTVISFSRATNATVIPVDGWQSMAADRMGRIFILAGGRIMRLSSGGTLQEVYNTGMTDPANLFIDSHDHFWITNRQKNRHLLLSDGTLTTLKFTVHGSRDVDTLSPAIRTMYEDRNGNIWFGTDGDGVLLYAPGLVQFMRAGTGFTRCVEWYDGSFWAGTYQNGLWKITPDFSGITRVTQPEGDKETYYLDLESDRHHRLWVVTREEIRVIDRQGTIRYILPMSCEQAKMEATTGDTMVCYSDSRRYRFLAGSRITLVDSSDFVQVMTMVHTPGAGWYGNRFGLYRFPKGMNLVRSNFMAERNRLSTYAVYNLLFFKGRVWAATCNGIEVFDTTGRKEVLPGFINELRNDVINALIPGLDGQLWFSGNRGIGCIDLNKEQIVFFNLKNNLQSLEFNSNAACQSPEGMICFGGIQGVNGFNPRWFRPVSTTAGVVMFSLQVADTALTPGIAPTFATIVLSRKAPHISGSVFCTDYTNAGAQVFSFFLEGFHSGWTKPSHSPVFDFRDLPPGRYKLLVKCADAWQNWSPPAHLLTVTLNPPFWKTYWFLILSFLGITVVTAMVVRKVNSIRYRQKILELEREQAVERERARISKDMHDEIGAGLTRISILGELAKKRHDDREASLALIGQISEIAGDTVDEMGEIIWAMNPKNDTLDSFTAYLRQYVLSYLETAGISAILDFPEEVPRLFMTAELRRNLFLVVKEALHNIVKHSGADKAALSLTMNSKTLVIHIRDNGRGFDARAIRQHGNGLVNMQRRIDDLGGTITLTSEPGKGTTIALSVFFGDMKNHMKGVTRN